LESSLGAEKLEMIAFYQGSRKLPEGEAYCSRCHV
jgi:hypothetical protein